MIRITDDDFKNLKNRTSRLSRIVPMKTPKSILHTKKTTKTIKTPPTESEGAISAGIEALMLSRGWYGIRINSGNVPVGVGENKRWFKGAPKGTPDRMFFRPHKDGGVILIFIEVKKQGKKPTDVQLMMMHKLRKYGAITRTARSKQDADAIHESLRELFAD